MKDEKKKKSVLLEELKESRLKISNLTLELNKTKEKILNIISELNEAKNKEKALISEIRNLQAEIKYMEANKKNIDILNSRIDSLEKLREELEQKLELKEKKIEELLLDKEILLKEKSEILEGKNEILQQIKERELELQEKSQRFIELRGKFKQSSSDLLSKSMQIEKLVKKDKTYEALKDKISSLENELEQKTISEKEKITEFEDKIKILEENLKVSHQKLKNLGSIEEQKKVMGELSTENTKVFLNMEEIIDKIKEILPQAKSNVRLVVPDINDLNKFELTKIIKKMPNKIRINIGANIEDPIGNAFVNNIKNYCQLTNYFDNKLIAVNIDSSKFLIAIFTDDNIIGIYTEILEIINILKPAIMEPFIKGIKIT